MLGYRKKSFTDAHTMLSTLRADPADFATLKSLQQLLCREIVRTEKKIRELKAERKAAIMAGGKRAARRSSALSLRVDRVRQCAYVWRCFGDAIAFLYMDKFALKQCYYRIEHFGVKQTAGFLSDKDGLANEIAWLEFSLAQKVPALLVDLTDTIRHGDVCLMYQPDPVLVEVKGGNELDRRARRQKRRLAKLKEFFEKDRIENWRGVTDVRRRAFKTLERNYADVLDECIGEAITKGHAVRTPERGLYYIATADGAPDIGDILNPLRLTKPGVFQLNEFKVERAWAPYYPFILSIGNRDHLWAFIRGEVYLMVIFEHDTLCHIAQEKGYDAKVDVNDEEHFFTILTSSPDTKISVSSHFIRRIGLEFVSPEWLVTVAIELLSSGVEEAALITE